MFDQRPRVLANIVPILTLLQLDRLNANRHASSYPNRRRVIVCPSVVSTSTFMTESNISLRELTYNAIIHLSRTGNY